MKRKVRWLMPEIYKNDYQYYRQWITNSWEKSGGKIKNGVKINFTLRMLLGKATFLANLIPDKIKRRDAVIVCCGAHPNYSAFPYNYNYEIIPIIWDCWPRYHETLFKSIKQNRIKTLFCTSSQVVEMVKARIPSINAFWLPEGIDMELYKSGGLLKERQIDILELGRQLPKLHQKIIELNRDRHLVHKFSEGKLLFKDFEELTNGLADSKITICYPRCDTHPEMAGTIETMTQRYWECMLSGTLIVGHAPKELVMFCGYNPVIELGDNPIKEISDIINNIDSYQELCNQNREFALKNSSWDKRIFIIKKHLIECGYEL